MSLTQLAKQQGNKLPPVPATESLSPSFISGLINNFKELMF